jgi:hypothetical protein
VGHVAQLLLGLPLFVHSILLLFSAPVSYASLSLPLPCYSYISAKKHKLLAVVTMIEEKRKRTHQRQRSSLFAAAPRRESDTRKTAGKHKTHRSHSQRPKEEMSTKRQPVVSLLAVNLDSSTSQTHRRSRQNERRSCIARPGLKLQEELRILHRPTISPSFE